jgi:hypothetical protein
MSPDGLLMMNLFDVSRSHELLASTVATLKRVFPTVVVLSVDSGSRMLLAFLRETSEASIRGRFNKFEGNEAIQRLARRAESQIVEAQTPGGITVFTDDFAPVEEITRRMLNRN